MPDSKPNQFVPFKPEKRCTVIVTYSEAYVIRELRKFQFGEFIIYKQANKIIRVEPKKSEIVTEALADEAALELSGKSDI
jgi:hypothetical protein